MATHETAYFTTIVSVRETDRLQLMCESMSLIRVAIIVMKGIFNLEAATEMDMEVGTMMAYGIPTEDPIMFVVTKTEAMCKKGATATKQILLTMVVQTVQATTTKMEKGLVRATTYPAITFRIMATVAICPTSSLGKTGAMKAHSAWIIVCLTIDNHRKILITAMVKATDAS